MTKPKAAEYKHGRRAPFVMVPVALLDDPRVDPSAIAAYAALQSYCDYGSEEGAFVTDRRACKRAHMGARTFRERRTMLREIGWVEWDSGKDEGRSNVYRVHQVGSAPGAHPSAGDADPGGQDTPTPFTTDTESHLTGDVRVNLPAIRSGMKAVQHSQIMGFIKQVEAETSLIKVKDNWTSLVVMAVYAYWVAVTGRDNARVRLSQDKALFIKARLQDARGGTPGAASCLLYAVDGALEDGRLVQQNTGETHLEIDNIFRSWSVVERCAHHMQGYRDGHEHAMVEKHGHFLEPDKQ